MICDPCRDEQYRWMDTKPSEMFTGIRIGNNAMYDMTARGVTDNRRARYEKWAALVREQCSAIREACEKGDHAA